MHRARLVAVAFVAAFAIALPLGAFAAHQFADVPDTNPFHADIAALANSGVTSGCGGENFCPKDVVTREQMAAFLNRLGALAPGKTPVVNADRVDGFHANALGRIAYSGSAADPILNGGLVASGTILSTEIDVPVAGYLAVTAHADSYIGPPYTLDPLTTADFVRCQLTVNDAAIDGSGTWIALSETVKEEDCAAVGTVVVCGPGPLTVAFEASDLNLGSRIGPSSLRAEFIPFGADGVAAAEICITGGPAVVGVGGSDSSARDR